MTMLFAVFGVGLLSLLGCVEANKHLWWEEAPPLEKWDDPCYIVVYGEKRFERVDLHFPAHCREGGLIWLGTTGRLHFWQYIDLDTNQEFQLCLTGGEPDILQGWYNYAGHHLEPIVYPIWYMRPRWHEVCKKSINGTMDLMFEPEMLRIFYYSWFTFNITLIEDYQPKPQPPTKPWKTPGVDSTDDASAFFKSKEKEINKRKDLGDIDVDIEDEEDVLADIDLDDGSFDFW